MNNFLFLLCVSCLLVANTHAFSVPFQTTIQTSQSQSHPCRYRDRRSHLPMEQQDGGTVNGLDDSSGTGMMLAFEKASLLASAFEALEEKDQYDAVLTGLCAKLLDNDKEKDASSRDTDVEEEAQRIGRDATLTPTQLAMEQLKDPIRLLGEMNLRNVRASGRSLMALVDVSYIIYILY